MKSLSMMLLFLLVSCAAWQPKEEIVKSRKPYKLGLVYAGSSQEEVNKILDMHELKRGQILIYQSVKSKNLVKVFVYPMRHLKYETGDQYWYLKRLTPLENVNNLANYNKPKGFFFSIPKQGKLAPKPVQHKGEVKSEDEDINYYYTFLY